MPDGYLMMVLHAHLPFVRHPEDPHFLEERWLFEAITETYIPLLSRMERLLADGVRARLTMTWSPPLCEMLVDPLLQSRYRLHVSRLLELAEQEVYAKQHSPFAEAARMYRDHYRYCLEICDRFGGNILSWVCQLRDAGVIEPITCGATHGFLPLMLTSEARRAQIAIAVNNYRKHFGCDPKGIWLPECGYVPGLEHLLKEQGIRFFFIDTHGVYFGTPRPRFGVYAPIFTETGVAAFGRDPESSRSVWSAEVGYPGDSLYREFYRDLGYDGDYDYVKNFLHPDGVRRNLGLKYHAVTGKVQLHEKAPYLPTPAFARAMNHGADFVAKRLEQARHLNQVIGRAPLIVSPYDAELFGHWWYEGTQFIESIYRAAQNGGHQILPVSGSDYLAEFPTHQVVTPSASSWGDAGYNGVWLNPSNDWIYRHLHAAEERMVTLAQRFPNADGFLRRALNQMARELLLAQSSDWAFIMTTATTVPYAVRRTRDHINRFMGLHEQVTTNQIREDSVCDIEWHDTAFQEIDYRVYAGPRR
jgi:1,4-alpha-glucan branching enzyme